MLKKKPSKVMDQISPSKKHLTAVVTQKKNVQDKKKRESREKKISKSLIWRNKDQFWSCFTFDKRRYVTQNGTNSGGKKRSKKATL